ncbi:hypothetical protein QL285_027262 [Trifolium repens]|nr:hypothetical protein QL285_027262 [Trifolium repens]
MTDAASASMKAVPHAYDVEDKSNKTAPKFNGDGSTFSWWKDRIYSHLIGIEDELWDLIEEGVTFKGLDERGKLSVEERKKFTPTDKKAYKKHHNRIYSHQLSFFVTLTCMFVSSSYVSSVIDLEKNQMK